MIKGTDLVPDIRDAQPVTVEIINTQQGFVKTVGIEVSSQRRVKSGTAQRVLKKDRSGSAVNQHLKGTGVVGPGPNGQVAEKIRCLVFIEVTRGRCSMGF